MATEVRRTRATLVLVLILVAAVGVAFGLESGGSNPRPHALAPLPGRWRLVFDSEFGGDQLNRNQWNAHDGWANQNNVTDHLGNVSVRDGHAVLTLAFADSGAAI